jgi:hypothetical protein
MIHAPGFSKEGADGECRRRRTEPKTKTTVMKGEAQWLDWFPLTAAN